MKRFLLSTILIASVPCIRAQAQIGTSVVYDPTQAAHAIQQIAQGENIIQNGLKIAQTTLAYYQFAQIMATDPAFLYAGFTSPYTYIQILEMTANTYGNSAPVMASANSGVGADAAYQLSSVPRTAMIPEYPMLGIQGQTQIAAIGATSDISDASAQSTLTVLGTIRTNALARDADINALESQSLTDDPLEATYMATMQRTNRATLLLVRQGQDANQLAQAIALNQIVMAKQQQDMIKAHAQDSQTYQMNFNANVAPAYAGTAAGLNY
jgi:hypothetical protein